MKSFFFFFLFTFHLSTCFSDNALDAFKDCGVSYNCGELVNITYPFWGNEKQSSCGRKEFKLNCKSNRTTTTYINSLEYNVLEINQSNNTMRIARSDLFDNYCPRNQIQVASIDHHPFAYSSRNQNISVGYNCSPDNEFLISKYKFSCGGEWQRRGRVNYAFEPSAAVYSKLAECEMKIEVMVTIKELKEGLKNRTSLVETAVKGGFEVEYENWYKGACDSCNGSGGNCGGNGTYPFYCICRNEVANPYACDAIAAPPRPPHPSHPENPNDTWKKVVIGAGSGIGGIVMMSIIFFIRLRMHKKKHQNYSCDRPMKELEKIEHYMALSLFSYHELVKATDKFNPANELGDGGFGTVYYGKLRDGREVAVKRLFENNYRKVEQFMNEVEMLTRLRHPHLVTLYGCTSRRSRELLLVYKFIPNGTVADHLHGNRARSGELPWLTRLKVAIETASALAFLHASETIHRDVKTTNILLDNNFGVKVADFGLSRLFPTQASHVSTAPQGTPGYIDPEYYESYQLTNKSDVFSFGVVLVELISSKPAVDITRHRHEINLSTMAINKIQNDELHDFVDPSLGFKTDQRIRNMICGVAELAFQCLQSVRDTRPSMMEALEILRNIENRSCGTGKAPLVPESPDSVTVLWISKTSTPNGSG
ncbi:LEAF RUST 10 DISEASE-RESISTANCE LOCUS RECEPTOR-LIKE PROTEIN KINASE-like 1.2 isoform X1 [Cucurbita maxima]|uniref:non-specific serine/threonine protein kinase n=1 Tax=Cucurbita maxima TaxID=3661 RepID=A0A6J1KJE6_CUCMA|nr:LEAF RUST 10 DISEASE-RESISTANCE LOCUS RECEPTOR-LIKE PROTEIN KINASE-like 1.2 isoform X1 [Cucurbita maxima]